jgi:tetratricopeptide (TPR) repeat protein
MAKICHWLMAFWILCAVVSCRPATAQVDEKRSPPPVIREDGTVVYLTEEMRREAAERAAKAYELAQEGFRLLKTKKPEEALGCFREAARLQESLPFISRGIIEANLMKGDKDAALAEYRRVLCKPEYLADGRMDGPFDQQVDFALLLNERKLWAEAVSAYGRIVNGLLRAGKGDYCAVPFATFLSNSPRYVAFERAARVLRAVDLATEGSGRWQEADDEFAAVLKADPKSAVAWYCRAVHFRKSQNPMDDEPRNAASLAMFRQAWSLANPREERAMTPVLIRRKIYEQVTGKPEPKPDEGEQPAQQPPGA